MDLKTLPSAFLAKKSRPWGRTPASFLSSSFHPPWRCVLVESCMSKHQPGHQPNRALARQPSASWFPGTAGAGATQMGPRAGVGGVRRQGPRSLSRLCGGSLPEPWPLGLGGLAALAQPGQVAVPVRGTAEGSSEASTDLRPQLE